MSYRAARVIVASGLALWAATVQAQTVVTPLFPGITHITRLIDLTSPGVRFKLTPPGENLPARSNAR